MKLYYSPGACSLAPHIVLHEGGFTFDVEKVDLKSHRTESGKDYYAVNPKGYVPALTLDGGETLTEGVAINLHLAGQKQGAKLAPASGSVEYARMVEWMVFISTELHKTFSPLFSGIGEDVKNVFRNNLAKRFEYVSKELGKKKYLMGEQFTLPDAYLFTILRWANNMKIDVAPNLREYHDRVAARPKVQEALKMEGLLAAKAA